MKKPIPYYVTLLAVLISLLLNMIPVVLLWEQAGVTIFSSFPLLCLIVALSNGFVACVCKHKGDYFGMRKWGTLIPFFQSDREYTFTEEYDRKFRWMLLVYFLPVPCYLPIILLANSMWDMLWALLVLLAPQIVYITVDVKEFVKEVKEQKEKEAKQERERLEQERREELGHWK